MGHLTIETGRALRRARTAQGLTLRDAAQLSSGWFTASAVAAYERGDRSISLSRFCRLCELYGLEPGRLLDDIVHGVGGAAAGSSS